MIRRRDQVVGDLTERLETRKLVERAKARLQQAFGMSEPDSRIGTRKPSTQAGAPTALVTQASTVFGLATASARSA